MYFRHLTTFLMYRRSLCALLDRKYPINLTLFFRPSILLECKISELAQLNEQKVRKAAKLEFSKWRSWGIKKAQEGSKMPQKWRFPSFDKNLINSDVLFLYEHKITAKPICLGNIWFLVIVRKPLDQSECRIL